MNKHKNRIYHNKYKQKKRALKKRNKTNYTKLPKNLISLHEKVRAQREMCSSSRYSNNEFTVLGELFVTQLVQLPLEAAINLQQKIKIKIK